MSIAKFSVRNSVLINLLMIGLFIFGGISLMRMPSELNPQIDFNWVFVTVSYPGAAPTEVENLIIDPIESEIQDVNKISEIQSNAIEGLGFVLVKFEDVSRKEFRELYTDLKSEVDKVELPEEAEDPMFEDFDSSDFLPIITINMSFNIPEDNAQKIADDLEQDLGDQPGVSKVQVSGLAEREIWIEVDPVKMNSLRVTFDEIIMALKMRNLNVPGGNVTFGKTEYLIRSLGEYQSIDEIKSTIVRSSTNGEFIKIKDIAEVNDRREEMPILSRNNGDNSITFSISKKSDANSLDVIDDVKAVVKEYQKQAPAGVEFSWTNDNSIYIIRVIRILRNNAITGMLLILLVLYIFLGKSNAFLASLGIPISFFITFIFMHLFDYTLNGNTLFALVMVLGIIVDDAIIVIENCHRYRLRGYNSFESAIRGTNEVVTPILSSIGTNIAAFLPLILLPGIMGRFMRVIPLVFSLALVASMFEAFFLLPSHYADWTIKSNVYKRGEKKFFTNLRKAYGRLLIGVLRKRYVLLGVMVFVLLVSIMLIPLIGIEMFGEEDFDQFKVLIKCPEGTSLKETDRIVRKFESEAAKLPQEDIQGVIVNVGLMQGNNEWMTRKSVAQVLFQLKPVEQRERTTDELIGLMRDRVKYISGPISVEFEKMPSGPPVGKPISVKVQGKYYADIKRASLALQDSIRAMKGTYNVSDDSPPGKQEIRIVVDEENAALYGFSTQFVAMNVRYAFDGIAATEYRDGDDEVDVVVKYNQNYRSSVNDVLNLKLNNAAGQTVALRDMVKFEIKPGPDEIKRFDQKRTIIVGGEINESETSLDDINKKLLTIFPTMEQQFAGITFKIGGEFEEFMNIFADITSLFILSLILIFLILGTQFNSYAQPLIILTTVPFALIGAMLGLVISGNPFSIVSLFGFVALAGIVVNDAIVMMDFMNKRRSGKETSVFQYWRSIVNSGQIRLRPIILTSLTTISGLIPMAFGIGGMSEMWSPLANVILFGLLVSTILTLFFIPCLMAILDDIKRSRKKALVG
ncbi:MAG: efflux RND transporter permease subunit [bacterium]|nr:MAG: efflux RND transporter permease subunit [bacterium]